jgi:hypothetical protein
MCGCSIVVSSSPRHGPVEAGDEHVPDGQVHADQHDARHTVGKPGRPDDRDGQRRAPDKWPPACLGEGLSNAQIAARLYLSEATVKGYVSRMLDKLGCANRTQAGLLAHDAGIVGQ